MLPCHKLMSNTCPPARLHWIAGEVSKHRLCSLEPMGIEVGGLRRVGFGSYTLPTAFQPKQLSFCIHCLYTGIVHRLLFE